MDFYIFWFTLAFFLASYQYNKGDINRSQFAVWLGAISLGVPNTLRGLGFEDGIWPFIFIIIYIGAVIAIIMNLPEATTKGKKKS